MKGYDYSSPGAYFVTICTKNKANIFGDIVDGAMILNEFGEIVKKIWFDLPNHFTNVQLDEFIVMPNHVHMIIFIIDDDHRHRRGLACQTPTKRTFGKPISGSLPTIIGSFKSAVTKRINRMRKMPGFPVWQRNYYEHIIRDEDELNAIRQYIIDNPQNWDIDTENPDFHENT